jgi:hypothetical protein
MFRAILFSSSGAQNCIFSASGIVTLCERPYSAPVKNGLVGGPINPLLTGALYGRSQRVTITDAVKIQFLPPEDEHSIARNMSRYLM